MAWLQGVLLGLVQGLTEFLPVSSSGHLVLAQALLGINPPGLTLEITVHLATLAAVVAVFWRDLAGILAALGRALSGAGSRARPGASTTPQPGAASAVRPGAGMSSRPGPKADVRPRGWSDPYLRLLVWLLVGTVPAVLAGLALGDWFSALFSSARAVGWALLLTGLLLALAGRRGRQGRDLERLGLRDALVVGVFQAAALAPGLSRSGATIAGGLFSGLERETAARFSFLLSVPAILGAGVLDLLGGAGGGGPAVAVDPRLLVAAAVTAALSGYVAVRLVLAALRTGRLGWFALYCWAVGLAALVMGRP